MKSVEVPDLLRVSDGDFGQRLGISRTFGSGDTVLANSLAIVPLRLDTVRGHVSQGVAPQAETVLDVIRLASFAFFIIFGASSTIWVRPLQSAEVHDVTALRGGERCVGNLRDRKRAGGEGDG